MCSQISQSLPDTCPVGSQNYVATPDVLSPPPPTVFGYLYSYIKSLKFLALNRDSFLFGRAQKCDRNLREVGPKIWNQISKEHFRIRCVKLESTTEVNVYLDDLSSNGTFVNEIRVGKGKSRLLHNNDRIACAVRNHSIFIFMDNTSNQLVSQYSKSVTSSYAISEQLGVGAYGQVRLVFDKNTGTGYAMKIVTKNKFLSANNGGNEKSNNTQTEIDILKKLNHQFVIQFHDVIDEPDKVYIIMELVAGGQLFQRVSDGPLPEKDAKYYFYQLALAVRYLHQEKIIHRDIKLENILLSSKIQDSMIKLADFGLSKFVKAESILKTYCGTPLYIAPEVLRNKGQDGSYDTQADIWSMGVVLYMCLSGRAPFTNNTTTGPTLSQQIDRGYYSFPERYWRSVSCEATQLVRRMLVVDPKKRITIDGILKHTWLQDSDMKSRVIQILGESLEDLENEEPEAKRPRYSDSESSTDYQPNKGTVISTSIHDNEDDTN